jgi:MFS superfamily sulfate permease-like transporter
MAFRGLKGIYKHNIHTLRSQPWAEISGALGDLGTLLPLMLALAQQGSISLSSTLVFSGLFNIITGALFGIPLPVQPMKAIAADVIRNRSDRGTITAAGGWVSAAVLVLTGTGGLRVLMRYIPVPVVKGIQLGAGLNLVSSVGGRFTEVGAMRAVGWAAAVGLVVTLALPRRRIPFALVIFVIGVAIASATSGGGSGDGSVFRPWIPHLSLPSWTSPSALTMALGQLPLTTLNSIIAASALASDLSPAHPLSVTALGYSVAGMNLLSCWFAAMPVCHGSGGLAAQWRFGARSGASIILLGLVKLLLGLVFGDALTHVIGRFPGTLLGVMVLGAGLELSRVAVAVNEEAGDLWEVASEGLLTGDEEEAETGKRRKVLGEEERAERWMVLLVTMAGIVAFRNDAMGFIGGMLCFWGYRCAEWLERRREGGALSI